MTERQRFIPTEKFSGRSHSYFRVTKTKYFRNIRYKIKHSDLRTKTNAPKAGVGQGRSYHSHVNAWLRPYHAISSTTSKVSRKNSRKQPLTTKNVVEVIHATLFGDWKSYEEHSGYAVSSWKNGRDTGACPPSYRLDARLPIRARILPLSWRLSRRFQIARDVARAIHLLIMHF